MSTMTSGTRFGFLAAGLAVVLVTLSAASQRTNVVFTGRVLDAGSGVPLAGASVTIAGTTFGNLADDEGRYLLTIERDALGDSVTLRAEFIGYRPDEGRIEVPTDTDRVEIDFRLETSRVELQALIVEGERGPLAPRDAAAVRGYRGAPGALRRHPDFNTESYDRIVENPFVSPILHPLSTLAADVDRASYGNVRRFLDHGQLPPVDAVRIEELINYFSYDLPDPDPDTGVPFSVTTEVSTTPWAPAHRLVRIGLQGRRIPVAAMPPSNLVFLLDTSGSMRAPRKLELVKVAMRMLVENLRPEDRVSIVTYAGSAGLVLPPTGGGEKAAIVAAIDRLEAGGSTAGGAGIRLAYDVAERGFIEGGNNRIVLATDGDFNVGPSSDAEMERLIEDRRETGVFLTALGFGYGNLKDSKLEGLADNGNGNYAYVDDEREARKVLVDEMAGTLLTIAKDVKLQVEWNPARVASYRLIGYENRLLEEEDFEDDAKDAGEIGAGHSVTVLYEVAPTPRREGPAARGPGGVEGDSLRYLTRLVRASAYESPELGWVSLRYKTPDGTASRLVERRLVDEDTDDATASADLRFAAAVAGYGMILRGSDHVGDFELADARDLALGALGEAPDESRREFLALVTKADELRRAAEPLAEARPDERRP